MTVIGKAPPGALAEALKVRVVVAVLFDPLRYTGEDPKAPVTQLVGLVAHAGIPATPKVTQPLNPFTDVTVTG